MKKLILAFVISLVVFFLALPTLLSTPWATKQIGKTLSSQTQTVNIESLSLSWLSGQKMGGFETSSKDLKVSIVQTTLETPLWKLLFNHQNLGHLTLSQPVIEYHYSGKSSDESPLIPLSTSLTVEDGKLSIIPRDAPVVSFDNINLNLTSDTLVARADAIEGKEKGTLDLSLTFSSLKTIKLEGNIGNFPSKFLHIWPLMDNLPAIVLGDRFDSNISCHLTNGSGDLFFSLSSPLSKIRLNAKVTDDILELNQPFEGEISITPELSNIIFQKTTFRPISSKGPIKIQINRDGTSIPLRDFAIDKIEIPSARVSLGQTIFLNAESLSNILGFIQMQVRANDHVPIWFQDAPIQISKGILQINRTELLVDRRYEIATWGNIDFKQKEPYAKMYIGITKQALEQAFNISNLPDNYTLPLPVDGPLTNLKIHKSKAAKTLAVLIGKEQLPIKGLLPPDLFTDDSIPIPPPRKPFPWK